MFLQKFCSYWQGPKCTSVAHRSIWGSFISYVCKILQKTNISYLLIRPLSYNNKITCAYQGVRNASFSKNFANVINKWSLAPLHFFVKKPKKKQITKQTNQKIEIVDWKELMYKIMTPKKVFKNLIQTVKLR